MIINNQNLVKNSTALKKFSTKYNNYICNTLRFCNNLCNIWKFYNT